MPARLGLNSEDPTNPMFTNYNVALKDSSNEIHNQAAPSLPKKKLRYGAHKGANIKPTFISFNCQNKSNRQNAHTNLTGSN
jgi:hypothetical protein